MATKPVLIPGPAQPLLAEALQLAPDATLGQMVDEIARLKMAACEGAAKRPTPKRGKFSVLEFPKREDLKDDDHPGD